MMFLIKKSVFIIFLLLIDLQINSIELPIQIGNISLNSIFMGIDTDNLYIPDTTNSYIVVFDKEGNYQKTITLINRFSGRINYFRKVTNGFLIYNNYSLLLIDNTGDILHKKNYPTGCTPSFISVTENYITILLPKVFNNRENTEILDIETLNPLGILNKIAVSPTTLSHDGIIPIRITHNSMIFYYIDSDEYLYWLNYENNTILKTDKTLKVISSINDNKNIVGYKTYVLFDSKLYTLFKSDKKLEISYICGTF